MLQYGSRALAFYVLSADPKSDVGQRLHALYKVMQQSRKAFRLGKSVTYYKKLQTLSGNKSLNETQRYLQFIQNLGMLGYFLADNVAFASKAKVLRFDAEELARAAASCGSAPMSLASSTLWTTSMPTRGASVCGSVAVGPRTDGNAASGDAKVAANDHRTPTTGATEAPEDAEIMNNPSVTSPSGLSASTMAAMNAAFEAAMTTAAQTARFYCVTVSPDARACARWPKLRGAAIAEGVQATSRVVEHVQMQLPSLRFHSMTADFIKDTSGVWWLTRVVDFQASSSIEPPRDDAFFGTRDSALSNTMNTRSCFLCGCSCELTRTFRGQLEAMVKGYSGDEYKTNSSISMKTPAVDEFRMTLTMALDTIFLVRQRGVSLPVWENAVSTVRKSQLRDVCDFPTCMLCYRIYQQQNRLQLLARELHCILSPNVVNPCDSPEVDSESTPTDGVGMATSAASGLASQLLSTELRYNQEAPKDVLDSLEAFQIEKIPPSLLLRGDSPELRPTGSTLTPMRGADVDPTATQLRLVFFFHELQDGGPDLDPTDFYLEYQLGQNVTRVQLEGSKRHTPNRWQLCEARVHYLCATLEAFSEFCSQKRLLIKLKAKPRSQSDDSDNEDSAANNEEEGQSPTGKPSRYRDKEESLDYLLELQTASYGLLTLKVTVGLLVDSVPLGHLRDVFRDRIFLEEHHQVESIGRHNLIILVAWQCLEIGSVHFAIRIHKAITHASQRGSWSLRYSRSNSFETSGHLSPSHSVAKITLPPHPGTETLTHHNSEEVAEAAATDINVKTSSTRRMSNVTTGKNWLATARSGTTGDDDVEITNTDQLQSEYSSRSLHLMAGSMTRTTLSQACLAAKRIVFRTTEDAATKKFPTVLLAAFLRHASFAIPSTSLSNWKAPATFHFTRRYSVDRLLAEVKPGTLPMLALLGELLLVLIEERELPGTIDASALESLLESFWQHDSGWRPIPRTQTSCLPERRVIWNRAIRRWEAATGNNIIDQISQPDGSIAQRHGDTLTADIGDFRTKILALVVCELFEQMESLDDGYIEIAELRSLAKCFPEQEYLCVELDTDVGTRERLTQEDIVVLAQLVDQQRRLALRTLLRSLMGTEKSPSKPERSPGSPQPTHTDYGTIVDAARFNGKRTLSGRSVDADFYAEGKQNLDPENVRRASTPPGFRRLSTDKRALDVPAVGPRRRRAVSGKTVTAQQVVDLELEGVLNRLHAAERTIVTGEAHANERKASVASVRTRQSSATTEGTSMSHTSPGSDLGGLARIPRRKSTKTPQISCQDDSTGPDKAAKKKRMKKRILKKTARRVRSANSLPTSDSLSKLLRMEFSDRVLSTSASESIIEKAVRIEQRRKEVRISSPMHGLIYVYNFLVFHACSSTDWYWPKSRKSNKDSPNY
ncbi:Peroxisomal biogenesis factor 11 [Phytophthora cactorum]|nr:Peroxisomal biogenesis factor 11 [Phytophthora cactorum]